MTESAIVPPNPEINAPPASVLRIVTAASLFDGHDVAINVMRRILQRTGAEVIHLGHNRSVQEIVSAVLQEDAQAVAVSSYQGGHLEYFRYLVDNLEAVGCGHVRVFGGGGGVITAAEIQALHDYGVTRIYSPEDGQRLGLRGMIDDMRRRCNHGQQEAAPAPLTDSSLDALRDGNRRMLARWLSVISEGRCDTESRARIHAMASADKSPPVIGITGTGGSGKSSLTDELIRRFILDHDHRLNIAILAVDPSQRRSGGALLGDRIRMNAIVGESIFMRSLATRTVGSEIPEHLALMIAVTRSAGFDVVIVETSGIGQGDTAIAPLVDLPIYVMTPEFGAPSQLEKIDMLDFAAMVAINKFDRQGADDALHDVRRQLVRNLEAFHVPAEQMPVFGTIASQFNDTGVTALYHAIVDNLHQRGLVSWSRGQLARPADCISSTTKTIVPVARSRYLAEIADTVRSYHQDARSQAQLARERGQLRASRTLLQHHGCDQTTAIDALIAEREHALHDRSRRLLDQWSSLCERYSSDTLQVEARGRTISTPLKRTTLSGSAVSRVALPRYTDDGDTLRFLLQENLPGYFPFTAGVFTFRREGEAPSRMFAGEGDARRTNSRFKLLSEHSTAKRLSTAFDSVTLYGFDPDERPDIYGKVGNSGVSIATLDDMKMLYDGFDLCAPTTSVSMTINGPAPTILAMFLNTAIDQQLDHFAQTHDREPDPDEAAALRADALSRVRGTVQADILKEDQGQNTCIFSTGFSLQVMGDIQQWFIDNRVQNFYSVSISGYHIAEAGANPITQLAFTLANGFTYVENYLARGMAVDDFAPNLSFFFSNGMDPEYAVIGRVARRIWAIAMRDRYHANERSQKLKYHIQTSGRSLHAQEIDFNDIRTTLQALIATYDHCNSLHTNAFDEAITTPTDESVRRALAIQMIINEEWGLAKTENPNQGAFIIEALTDQVEEAVLQEFGHLTARGGVLGAMETGYQRSRIQDQSIEYERRKHDGSLPIIGVNAFLNPNPSEIPETTAVPLSRSTEAEKHSQLQRLRTFHQQHADTAPAALERLRQAVINNDNVFATLMETVRCCSLGQITTALFAVGGQYRRTM